MSETSVGEVVSFENQSVPQEEARVSEGEAKKSKGFFRRPIRLFLNILRAFGKFLWKHKVFAVFFLPIFVFTLIAFRAFVQPAVLWVRIQSFEFGCVALFLLWIRFWFKRKRLWPIIISCVVVAGGVSTIILGGFAPQRFLTLYNQYRKLEIVELDVLPKTLNDRVHPLNSIYTESNQRLSKSNSRSTMPDIVRWSDDSDVWTIGVEPKFAESRLFGSVQVVRVLPANKVNLEFTPETEKEVFFDSGEDMLFWKDLHYIVRQRFGLWKFLSYEPSNVKYVPGPDGEIVQVVALVKWSGIFRPRPVPGGVFVFKQGHRNALYLAKRILVGEGEWIAPDKIKDHDWLAGQNIMPYSHSEHIGESFRFQYGLLAPMPGRHKNDIRIPHLEGDVNQQPYTIHFDMPGKYPDKLYHFFALEPYQEKLKGVNTLVFIPADTIGPVYVYRAAERGDNIVGVTTVATRMRDVTKEYNATDRIIFPAEHRPFFKEIDGKVRPGWLSTMVSRSMENKDEYLSSAAENFITDGSGGASFSVQNYSPSKWVDVWKEKISE